MLIRLLVASDGVAPTGLSRAIHALLGRLSPETFEIHHLAINYRGDPHSTPWKVYPAALGGDPYGFGRLIKLVNFVRPHIVFLLNDLWILAEYLRILREAPISTKIAVWAYVESEPVDPDWLNGFRRINQLVTCTDFAKRLILEALNLKNPNDISIIPLGIDASTFCPLDTPRGFTGDKTLEAKSKLRIFQEEELDESFIVLNANRNQPRKRIDSTIRAFSEFAKGKPNNVKLYLHMGQQDAGWNVIKLCRRFGIEDRLIMSDSGGLVPDISDEDMNLIYNACDVGLNTSSCEGWGLVAFEHAAVGRAQVMTDSPQLRELWEGSAILAPVNRMVVHEGTLLNGYLVDEDGLSSILERLYCDKSERLKWSQSALEKATKAEYSWDSIARSWEARFREL